MYRSSQNNNVSTNSILVAVSYSDLFLLIKHSYMFLQSFADIAKHDALSLSYWSAYTIEFLILIVELYNVCPQTDFNYNL